MSIGSSGGAKKSARKIGKKSGTAGSGDAVVAPMQGTIVKTAVTEGQEVAQGDLVVVLEAMKMEQPLTAHKSGIVTGLNAEVGTTVPTGTELMEIK
jgi:acetyl-CoA/propionyl-CoA carboxylase biotin carboxyl carrier protein